MKISAKKGVYLFALAALFLFSCGKRNEERQVKYSKTGLITFCAGEVKVNGRSNVCGKQLSSGDRIKTGNGKLDFASKNIATVRVMENTDLVFAGVTDDGISLALTSGKALIKNEAGKSEILTGNKKGAVFAFEQKAKFSVEVMPDIVKAYVYDGLLEFRNSDNVNPVYIEPGNRFFVKKDKFRKEKYSIPWDLKEFDRLNDYSVEGSKCDSGSDSDIDGEKKKEDTGGSTVIPVDSLEKVKQSLKEKKEKISEGIADKKEEISEGIAEKKEELSDDLSKKKDEYTEKAGDTWESFKEKVDEQKEKIKAGLKKGIDKI